MMSSIKDKRRKNNDDKLSKYSENAKIIIRQEPNAILEKIVHSETRNDNEKIFSHEFSENNAVDYISFVEKKRVRSKNLKIKRKYQILLRRNKRL